MVSQVSNATISDHSSPVSERVQCLINCFIQHQLPVLLVVAHDQHTLPQEQFRQRVNMLIGCLTTYELEESLVVDNRRVMTHLQKAKPYPQLKLNAGWLKDVDNREFLTALSSPIAKILDIPPLIASLVLREDDEKQLRNLYAHALRKVHRQQLIRTTDIPLYIKRRVDLFLSRLTHLLTAIQCDLSPKLDDYQQFLQDLLNHENEWPDWETIAEHSSLIRLQQAITRARDQHPIIIPAAVLVEFCWESLTLFPQTFLYHAAQKLRATNLSSNHWNQVLEALYTMVDDHTLSRDAQSWSNFQTIVQLWNQYLAIERHQISPGAVFQATTLDILAPPERSMGFSQPTSLPWELPLMAWSSRERKALTDFINGNIQTLSNDNGSITLDNLRIPHFQLKEPPLNTYNPLTTLLNVELSPPQHQNAMCDQNLVCRAANASLSTLLVQFSRLDSKQDQEMIQRLIDAYCTYFPDASALWEQKFAHNDSMRKVRLFELIVTELQKHYQLPILLNPFAGADDIDLLPRPALEIIVPFKADTTACSCFIPLPLLRCALENQAPIRLRTIQVDGSQSSPCRWLGDTILAAGEFENQPTVSIINAVWQDTLHLSVTY